MLLSDLLQIQIDRRHHVLARLRFDSFDLALNVAATVDNNFAIAVFAAQIIVVNFFDAFLADDIAGLQAFVFVRLLVELFRAYFTDIAKHVRQHSVRRIAALRLLLDAQLGKLELVRFDPGDVAGGRVLLDGNRFKGRARI